MFLNTSGFSELTIEDYEKLTNMLNTQYKKIHDDLLIIRSDIEKVQTDLSKDIEGLRDDVNRSESRTTDLIHKTDSKTNESANERFNSIGGELNRIHSQLTTTQIVGGTVIGVIFAGIIAILGYTINPKKNKINT